MTPKVLYLFSVLSIIVGGLFAGLHGLYSRNGHKIKERLAEFGRNACIQISAMLFALATALFIHEGQVSQKNSDQASAEKSVAYSAVAIRASVIEGKVKSFAITNKVEISLPGCLYEETARAEHFKRKQTKDITEDCKHAIYDEAKFNAAKYNEIKGRLESVDEALNVKDDWIKYPFFSRNLDKEILSRFLNLQTILKYRENEAIKIVFNLRYIDNTSTSIDKIVFDIDHYNREILSYSKTAIIFLYLYYYSFGDIDAESSAISKAQTKLINDVRENFELYDKLAIDKFTNTLSLRAQDCSFQTFKCYELMGGISLVYHYFYHLARRTTP